MSQLRRFLPPGAAVAALLVAAPIAPAERPVASASACTATSARPDEPRPPCCFQNPRYVGVCEVAPGKGETCASILEYLNNLQSSGRDYCNSTAIRGGWKIVPCEPKMKTN